MNCISLASGMSRQYSEQNKQALIEQKELETLMLTLRQAIGNKDFDLIITWSFSYTFLI